MAGEDTSFLYKSSGTAIFNPGFRS